MSNMSYCRFENTARDLRDCASHIGDDLDGDESRARLGFMRRDPRVSLTVLDAESWYRQVTLLGRVAELVEDDDLADIDRLSRHYGGEPFHDRESRRVSAWVEVESWHLWPPA